MKLGFIARQDLTGLGFQSRAITRMLKPDKLLIIDSTFFNGNSQHPDWYEGYDTFTISHWPTTLDCNRFLRGLTHVITCETAYNPSFYQLARKRGVKTYNQYNYEFLDYLKNPYMTLPTRFLAPSAWHIGDVERLFPGRVLHLPPPTSHQDFTEARNVNLARTGRRRFVHVVGKAAVHDRNGTLSLLEALKHSHEYFELVIKAQAPMDLDASDPRVRFDYTNPLDQADLYRDFDALILPRRYGGLSLPVNEALMSALPVVMTDVTPNNQLLPPEWLVPAQKTGEFMTRTMIDIHSADAVTLGGKLDELATMSGRDLQAAKAKAFDIGYSNFAADVLRPKYQEVLQ